MHEATLSMKQLRQTAKHSDSIQLHTSYASCLKAGHEPGQSGNMSTCTAVANRREDEVQRIHGLEGMLARVCTTSGRTSPSAYEAGHHDMCRKDVKFFNTCVTTMLKIGVDSRRRFSHSAFKHNSES